MEIESEGDAFHEIYRDYAGLVRGVLFNLCGQSELDDLVQETFIKVWRGLPEFRGGASLKTWIYRIAANTAMDHLRSRRKTVEVEPDEIPAQSAEHEQRLADRDLVEKGLARLSPDLRAVMVFAVFEELPMKTVAELMGIPEGTVKSRLNQARRELAVYFESMEGIHAQR